jgi:rhodanese-related sulfurtransferase
MNIKVINENNDYAGDVHPNDVWKYLLSEPFSQLIDVRTKAELNFVGMPDLSTANKYVHNVEWQHYPSMDINHNFDFEIENILKELNFNSDDPLFFMCRSGARSSNAAKLMTSIGWNNSYNVLYGFEGDPDTSHKRGLTNGWKYEGLPWIQQ